MRPNNNPAIFAPSDQYRSVGIINLRSYKQVIICKANWYNEIEESMPFGQPVVSGTEIVKEYFFEENATSTFAWQAKKNDGTPEPSGFYRIYVVFINDEVDFLDVYLIQPEDYCSWNDPSGYYEGAPELCELFQNF